MQSGLLLAGAGAFVGFAGGFLVGDKLGDRPAAAAASLEPLAGLADYFSGRAKEIGEQVANYPCRDVATWLGDNYKQEEHAFNLLVIWFDIYKGPHADRFNAVARELQEVEAAMTMKRCKEE